MDYRNLIKKAKQSICWYKVSAMGFDRKGDFVDIVSNKPFLNKRGGSYHAEMQLMKRYGRIIKTIVICRVNRNGKLCKIDPCVACGSLAKMLKIKIVSIINNKELEKGVLP